MAKQRYTPEQVIQALEAHQGRVFVAARALGCSHDTVERMIARHPAVAAVRNQHRGETVDEAEKALRDAIARGEPWAVSLALKTIGKSRGYVERQEVQVVDGDIDAAIDAELARLAGRGKAEAAPAAEGEGPAG